MRHLYKTHPPTLRHTYTHAKLKITHNKQIHLLIQNSNATGCPKYIYIYVWGFFVVFFAKSGNPGEELGITRLRFSLYLITVEQPIWWNCFWAAERIACQEIVSQCPKINRAKAFPLLTWPPIYLASDLGLHKGAWDMLLITCCPSVSLLLLNTINEIRKGGIQLSLPCLSWSIYWHSSEWVSLSAFC